MTSKRILAVTMCVLGALSKAGLAESSDIVRSYRIEAKDMAADGAAPARP